MPQNSFPLNPAPTDLARVVDEWARGLLTEGGRIEEAITANPDALRAFLEQCVANPELRANMSGHRVRSEVYFRIGQIVVTEGKGRSATVISSEVERSPKE